MTTLTKGLVGLSALAFLLAAAGSGILVGTIAGIPPEAFSRASTNLALLAIALVVCWKPKPAA
jgi:hypothetical protein